MNSRVTIASVILSACLAPASFAQSTIQVDGSVSGFFNNGKTSIDGLSYKGSSFDLTGTLQQLGQPSFVALMQMDGKAGAPNIDNFGSFFATKSVSAYAGDTFTFDVTLKTPTLSAGSDKISQTWLIGSDGEFHIQSQTEGNFSTSKWLGEVGMTFSPTFPAVTKGTWVAANGEMGVTAKPVPEPTPMLACSAFGLGLVFVRRKKKAAVGL